jgi:uncharacterized protein involved in cysteine biosynthesis
MLMPAVTAMVGSFFADQIGEEVEREYYPGDPPGKAVPLWLALWEGLKTALLALLVYLCAAPLLLFAGFGAIVFFLATAYVLGREYFELAAMRLRPRAEAKALRRRNATARGHALAPARGGQSAAPAQCHHGLCWRPIHRRFRFDSDREPGGAAIRHGFHGASA